jgi:hypothetical protein
LATGLRLGEFTHLLRWEIPALPASATAIPIPFPVPERITKGRKARTTWISYEALAGLLDHLQLDRAAATKGSGWRPPRRWGEPLMVTDPDARGGRINGVRRSWASLTTTERRRLVAPTGGSCLLAVRGDGGPFTAWATVFERTAYRAGWPDLAQGHRAAPVRRRLVELHPRGRVAGAKCLWPTDVSSSPRSPRAAGVWSPKS